MTKYNPKEIRYFVLDYEELDKIVNEYFGRVPTAESNKKALDGYFFVASEEMGNDAEKEFLGITLAEYEKELNSPYFLKSTRYHNGKFWDVPVGEMIREGQCPMFVTREILLELVAHDILPEGNYLIKVSW
jgi:hypothetical protein